ncbi:MAG: hypothetical protein ACRCZF_16885 [Gemmataceae bacterium]
MNENLPTNLSADDWVIPLHGTEIPAEPPQQEPALRFPNPEVPPATPPALLFRDTDLPSDLGFHPRLRRSA